MAEEPRSADVTQSSLSVGPSRERDLRTPKQWTVSAEPKNRTMLRRVVSNLKTNRNRKRWHMLLEKDKAEDVNDEYVIK